MSAEPMLNDAIPHKDAYAPVRKSVRQRWMDEWSATADNKLRLIKEDINAWSSSSNRRIGTGK